MKQDGLRLAALAAAVLSVAACVADTSTRYRDYASVLQRDGYLRTETSPIDAPFSNADLERNFVTVALNREYRRDNGTLIQAPTPSPVSRWTEPIRYRIAGDGATDLDRSEYASFFAHLARLTNLDMQETEERPNLSILILDAEERNAFVEALKADGAAARMPLIVEWAEEVRYPCVGQVGYENSANGRISGAMIVIKAELEGVMRRSCIHEELTQALGLMNDDDSVRPSIFNDDQEFAYLTEHDEYLLRILYDRRLRPGMTEDEVRPLLSRIVRELRPEG